MAINYLSYWKPDTAKFHQGLFADHTASDQYSSICSGDVIWIVTVWHGGRLALLGRITVDVITGQVEAEHRIGPNVWKAKYHLFPSFNDTEPMRDVDLMDIAVKIRFESDRDRLDIVDGCVDAKQLQRIRRLTPKTAALILAKWEEDSANLSGKYLNELWGVGAKHSLYREDGKWYHQLLEFPGALFDANGYILFETKKDYLASPYLQIRQDLHISNGISEIPNYIRITEGAKLQTISQAIKRESAQQQAHRTGDSSSQKNNTLISLQVPRRSLVQSNRIIRDTKVSICVKHLHSYKCQLCGEALEIGNNLFYAEAHHLKPLGNNHQGPDVIENIICVCPNHHALLDLGAIIIDGSKLLMIKDHEINPEYIEYHNSAIYKKRTNTDSS